MLETAALAAGLSWTSGFRLYLAVFAAGVLGRTSWLHLPPGLQMLESWWVIGLAGVLAVAEFLADKIPGFDSVWDGIQTFIRVPAGAILAAAAFGQLDPQWMVAAGLIGGTLAGTAHATFADGIFPASCVLGGPGAAAVGIGVVTAQAVARREAPAGCAARAIT